MPHLLYITICLFAFAACNIAEKEGNDDEAVTRGNTYIDHLIKDMFEGNTDKFDPYEMEDSVVGFNKKMIFVNVSGEAKLHDGTLKGLSTLHRADDCALHEKDGRLKVNAKLGAGVLNFHYSGSAKFMNYGPTITVHGTLSYVEVVMEFTVDAKTGKNGKLTKFIIDDMRDMRVWVTGLGPISWAMNPVINAVTKIFRRILRQFLENRVQKYIDNRLPNYQFPVEGGGITESPLTKPTESEGTTQTTEQELTTQTSEPEITTVKQTAEPEITTSEQTTQPPEPDTTIPTETPNPEEPVTTVSEEPETAATEEPVTTVSEEPETAATEEPVTTVSEEPETAATEEREIETSEIIDTTVTEEPETQTPEETPSPEEPAKLEE